MSTFLEYIAKDILLKYGSDLSRIAVVFPNKRASLFLNSHLASLSEKPIWSPAYITISELIRQNSQKTVADPIKLVCDLYKSYVAITGSNETLDHFYSWGQLLIADFDDLDKNMANADKVFANLRDIHEYDDVSHLTDDQRKALQRFFKNFAENQDTLLKERFLNLWSKIGAIYHDFNNRLAQQGLAYEGALYREVAESDLENLPLDYDVYLFVGFNLVQPVEQCLFKSLRQQGKARFYWDFDKSYMDNNEAGFYIKKLIADFPNEFDVDNDDIYNQYAQAKDIHFVSSTTENAQARFVSQWLREKGRINGGRKTAVVLCNEALLPAVVHCIPDEVEKVNITTGYPLAQSPVASLITLLCELRILGYDTKRKHFRRRYQDAVTRHPYMAQLPEEDVHHLLEEETDLLSWMRNIIQHIARTIHDDDPLFQECLFRCYTLLNRLQGLVESGDLIVDDTTLQRLLNQLIQSTSVPFHGEPIEGIQIMGVLETRNLDFEHVLLLSCNEGNMPRGVNDTSFIPYTIRDANHMTTIDHKVAIYSYYFHRLLQRASDITILYNNSTTDGKASEMSRFMLQMMVEDTKHEIHFNAIQTPAAIYRSNPPIVKLEKKKQLSFLTPTAINTYMRCPLRYYYKYECGLQEPIEDMEETIDNRIFGNIFHEASQRIYEKLMAKSKQILKSDIEALLKNQSEIERAIDEAIQKEMKVTSLNPEMLNGLQIINRQVLIHYLRQLLQIDHKLAPFHIIGLECDVQAPLETASTKTVIGGRIDRLDRIVKDGVERIRVIDYKTGSKLLKPLSDVDAIFKQESLVNHSDYYLQTFLYAALVKQKNIAVPVSPALLFIQHASGENYDPTLSFGKETITDVGPNLSRFMELLRNTVDEMFNSDIPYQPTDHRERCEFCPYRQLCL